MEHTQRSEPSAAAHRPARAKGYTKRALVLAFLAGNMVPIAMGAAILFWPHHSRPRSSQSKSVWKTIQSIWHRPPQPYSGLRSRPIKKKYASAAEEYRHLQLEEKRIARFEEKQRQLDKEQPLPPLPDETGSMRVRVVQPDGRPRFVYVVEVRFTVRRLPRVLPGGGRGEPDEEELYQSRVIRVDSGPAQDPYKSANGRWYAYAQTPDGSWRDVLKKLRGYHYHFHPECTVEYGPFTEASASETTEAESSEAHSSPADPPVRP